MCGEIDVRDVSQVKNMDCLFYNKKTMLCIKVRVRDFIIDLVGATNLNLLQFPILSRHAEPPPARMSPIVTAGLLEASIVWSSRRT